MSSLGYSVDQIGVLDESISVSTDANNEVSENFRNKFDKEIRQNLTETDNNKLVEMYLQQKDPNIVNVLLQKVQPTMYRTSLKLFKHQADAQDATQEALIKVYTQLEAFNGSGTFTAWSCRISRNTGLNILNSRNIKKKIKILDADIVWDIIENPTLQEKGDMDIRTRKNKILKQVLEQLPSQDKELLLLKYKSDMTIKEIALQFDQAPKTIDRKLCHARKSAREIAANMNVDSRSIDYPNM